MNSFKYIELFAGIGGFRQALDRLGGECVFASEIDPFAQKAYRALYGQPNGTCPELHGDITKIDAKDIPDHDVLTAGFPCQAFSVAGQRKGFEDTRGTLFFEIARIAAEKRPKALLLENVKGLVNHGKGETLRIMLETLGDIGYTVDFDVLNSKFFGVPQNRERIFIVAIRDDLVEQADWTNTEGMTIVPRAKKRLSGNPRIKTFNFDYPEQVSVTSRLRDVLEPHVDEKYYLSDERTAALVAQLEERKQSEEPALEPQMLGHVDIRGHDAIRRVYSADAIGPTLTTMGGGHREPKIAEPQSIAAGGDLSYCIDANYAKGLSPSSVNKGRRTHIEEVRPVLTPDRVEKQQNGRRFKDDGEESFTLTAQDKHGVALDGGEDLIVEEKKRNTIKILRALCEEIGEEALLEWSVGITASFQQTEVLRSGMYEEGLHAAQTAEQQQTEQSIERAASDGLFHKADRVSKLRSNGESGRPSYRREPVQQRIEQLAIIMSRMSSSGTPFEDLFDMRVEAQGARILRKALSEIQKIWGSVGVRPRYRIRKLTPKECFRLQGFSDEAHDTVATAGISDSQRYKQAGNAVTVNVIDAIGRRLLRYLTGDNGEVSAA